MLRNGVRVLLICSIMGNYSTVNATCCDYLFSGCNNLYIKALAGESWEMHNTVTSPGRAFVTNSMISAVITGGVGYRFFPYLRGEIEYSYRPNYQLQTHSNVRNISDSSIGFSDIKAQAGMANLYLDYPIAWLTPYLFGGIGFGIISYGVTSIYNVTLQNLPVGTVQSNTNHNFVDQVGGGFLVNLTKNLKLDLNYRFVDMGQIKSGHGLNVVGNTPAHPSNGFFSPSTVDQFYLKSNELQLGIHYYF